MQNVLHRRKRINAPPIPTPPTPPPAPPPPLPTPPPPTLTHTQQPTMSEIVSSIIDYFALTLWSGHFPVAEMSGYFLYCHALYKFLYKFNTAVKTLIRGRRKVSNLIRRCSLHCFPMSFDGTLHGFDTISVALNSMRRWGRVLQQYVSNDNEPRHLKWELNDSKKR